MFDVVLSSVQRANITSDRIVCFLIAVAIAGSAPIRFVGAQDSQARQRAGALSGARTAALVVGNSRITWGPWCIRSISVFVEPGEFTIQNLRAVFLSLSEQYSEDHLTISAFSDLRQSESKAESIAAIRPAPITPSDTPPDDFCPSGIEPPPLSAKYFRSDLSEYFGYHTRTGESIIVELVSSDPICGPRDDPVMDLIGSSIRGCQDRVRELLDSGIDPKTKGRHGCSALVEASFWGHYEIVDLLLRAGADINQTTASGWTPLMSALVPGRDDVVALLLSRGADLKIRGEDGNTALTIAVLRKNADSVRNLLAYGADVTVRSGDGRTPLEIAESLNNIEVIRLLKDAGGR